MRHWSKTLRWGIQYLTVDKHCLQEPFINGFKEKKTFYYKNGRQLPDKLSLSLSLFSN